MKPQMTVGCIFKRLIVIVNNSFDFTDGFTFVKRHQAALIQRLKSVEPVLEHLREQNVLCKFFVLFAL